MPANPRFEDAIARELSAAREAEAGGNAGRARVCARRAAGEALAWYLDSHPSEDWGRDAVSRLRRFQDEDSFPAVAREAARRLAARVTPDFGYPAGADPVEDALAVVAAVKGRIDAG